MRPSIASCLIFALALILTSAGLNPTTAQQAVEDQYWEAVRNSTDKADLERYLKEYPNGKYAAEARRKLGSKTGPGGFNYLVTPDAAGDLRLGMTVADARKVFSNAVFEQYNYSEEGNWVEVKRGGKILITFMTDQQNEMGDEQGRVPIRESARIESIAISDPLYRTAAGIGIGSTLRAAEKSLGAVGRITLQEYDGSEHAEFSKAPPNYTFTVRPKAGSAPDARVGIYGRDEYSTIRFDPNSLIDSILISEPALPEEVAKYRITDDSVGKVRLGMTVAEARQVMQGSTFILSGNDPMHLIVDGETGGVMQFATLNIDEKGNELPLGDSSKIIMLQVNDSRFQTAEGVRPGMSIAEAEKKFGKLKELSLSYGTIESGTFTAQPKSMSFVFQGIGTELAGRYDDSKGGDPREKYTTRYDPAAYISSISVHYPFDEKVVDAAPRREGADVAVD